MNIKMCNLLKNYFSWMKNDFYFICILAFSAFFIFNFFHPNRLIIEITWIIIFIKSLKFSRTYSLSPSVNSGGDHFSWKFLQGLPLSKKDLILAINFANIIVSLPLLLVFALAWKDILAFGYFENLDLLKFSINYLLIIYIVSIMSINNLIQYPRVEYRNKTNKHQLLHIFRSIMMFLVFSTYSWFFGNYIHKQYDINLFNYMARLVDFGGGLLTSWWFLPIALALIFLLYKGTLNIWVDEKKTYHSKVTTAKKEWGLIIVFGFLLILPIKLTDFNTPLFYQDSLLNQATFKKDYAQIDALLSRKKNINLRNKYEFNPMFVAIQEGDLNTIKFLEERGASFKGILSRKAKSLSGFDALMLAIHSKNLKTVKYILSKGFDVNKKNQDSDFYPIHLAAFHCNSQILDLLIEEGANVNLHNLKGETPALVAVRANCFSGAVALREAGAAFGIADKNGKKDLDYFSDKKNKYINLEFKYFVEKHSRSPASTRSFK